MTVRYDASNSLVLVRAYREGVLARVGHDVSFRVARYRIDVDPEALALDARFEADSLRLERAASGGGAPSDVSAADRAEIEANAARGVLQAERFPEVRFRSTRVEPAGGGYRVAGELTLRGRTRAIQFTTRDERGRQVADVSVSQPDFGIAPFKALLGALRVRPDVDVRVELPWPPG
jgi:hypothetical protein